LVSDCKVLASQKKVGLTMLGIGGEYPAGSVGCAEGTGELKAGSRNKWFIMFTNVQIDLAFLIAAIVATVVVS
jgi:hypothetical protein